MIEHLSGAPAGAEAYGAFLAVCGEDPVFGAELETLLAVFGPGSCMADFWLAREGDGSPRGAACLENGRLMVAGRDLSGALAEELRLFAETLGGWQVFRAEESLCRSLFPGGKITAAPVMCCPGEAGDWADPRIRENPPLEELYRVICEGFDWSANGGRDRWYAYTSHLFRHGLGFACCLYEGGQAVCTGGVYAWSRRQGVLGCIATLPPYRGRGYAAKVTRYLCGRVREAGRTPTLLCAEESLGRYYETLGFRHCARWGELRR